MRRFLQLRVISYPPLPKEQCMLLIFHNLGLAGLPQNSQGTTENDGVVINTPNFGNTGYVAFPYDGGRTSTHEVGHFLGLRHIWGDVNGCGGTDYCDGISLSPYLFVCLSLGLSLSLSRSLSLSPPHIILFCTFA